MIVFVLIGSVRPIVVVRPLSVRPSRPVVVRPLSVRTVVSRRRRRRPLSVRQSRPPSRRRRPSSVRPSRLSILRPLSVSADGD